jgi:glutamyl-Q tRNA(Asp) synthetase
LGSLFTALASFLDARSREGLWLLRIDDLDTPRNIPGADDAILKTLEAFGLHWDKVAYQSQHQSAYNQALQQLQNQHLLYRCTCSRKSLSGLPTTHIAADPIYPNICRLKNQQSAHHYALRLKTEPLTIAFDDALQGTITENLATQYGDFIVQRKDKVIAYQLAVVMDDYLQNINYVVRGADLLSSTIKQIYLHRCLNLPIPHFMHVPALTGPQGAKLSKRDFAPAVSKQNSYQTLYKLLELLNQNPPTELKHETVATQLHWATEHWNPMALSLIRNIDVTGNNCL